MDSIHNSLVSVLLTFLSDNTGHKKLVIFETEGEVGVMQSIGSPGTPTLDERSGTSEIAARPNEGSDSITEYLPLKNFMPTSESCRQSRYVRTYLETKVITPRPQQCQIMNIHHSSIDSDATSSEEPSKEELLRKQLTTAPEKTAVTFNKKVCRNYKPYETCEDILSASSKDEANQWLIGMYKGHSPDIS